ncbi:MAG TPA: CehA/McbA family metallohydrolase [Anaerolineales bacterium]|nr:CehA/McbA family metallohydrolase [Anaerolineales bacterium]
MNEHHEIVVNLHMHTPYSDGHGSHKQIADAALKVGLDAVIVTDHNVWVNGPEGYYQDGPKRLLMLIGEEIHDQARDPQKNHMLVFGAERELAPLAYDPQKLLNGVNEAGGMAFLAHPTDPENKVIKEDDLSWVSWDIQGFTGIELWNSLSELKFRIKNYLHAIFYVLYPTHVNISPPAQTISIWDELHKSGKKVVAVGGSDAHALPVHLGPISRRVYPYEHHFRCINTHLLLPEPLNGNLDHDKKLIYDALRTGHAFVAYDLPAPTKNFRFAAHAREASVSMGDEVVIRPGQGVTFQIRLPEVTECILLKDGKPLKTWENRETITYNTTETGVYRVEVYREFLRQRCAWIFSNPIYVRA